MKYVIIGNSAAGTAAAETLRQQDATGEIIMISRDTEFYSRCQLHLIASGKRSPAQANFLPQDWARRHGVSLHLGCNVREVDMAHRRILCESGETFDYNRLLLATGSRSVLPPIEGMEGPGVYGLRDLQDACTLYETYRDKQHIVIIGAGLVGTELAEALVEVGHPSVSLVEMSAYPLPLQLEEVTGTRMGQLLQRHGVNLYCGDGVTKLERSADGLPAAVHLKSGRRLPADLVVAAAGVRANVEMLSRLGAECQRGVVVDAQCRTSLPDIYAAGDVTECRDVTLDRVMSSAIWPAARRQGRVAGINMAGGAASLQEHTGLRASVSLFGTSVISVGAVFSPDPAWDKQVYDHTDSRGRLCSKVCYTDREGVLKAAILWGDVSLGGLYGEAVLKGWQLGDLAPAGVPAGHLQSVA